LFVSFRGEDVASSIDKVPKTPAAPGTPGPFGHYQLLELIGKGGMAEVFRAAAPGIDGFDDGFVVKRIRPDKSDSPKFVQAFCEEARITALLRHPNIVQVYDFGQIDGAYFMAMEYLRGKDLSTVMRAARARRGALPPALAVFVAREIALALHHAHTLRLPDGTAAGIVHRDVTPSNIMLLQAGGVKILDFGIARAVAVARPQEAGDKRPRLAGKLAYVSPELVRGAAVDHRSDVFSLGVVLWEMVAGQRLFAADSEADTLRNVLLQPIAEASRRRDDIPAKLDAIIARALEREPADRYQTAAEFAAELDKFLADAPIGPSAIPDLLADLFSAQAKQAEADDRPSATYFTSGTRSGAGARTAPQIVVTHGTGRRLAYRSIMLPPAPKVSLPVLIGIFALVVAAVVIVGRLVLRH
jgi:serine/threonine-protein kinase